MPPSPGGDRRSGGTARCAAGRPTPGSAQCASTASSSPTGPQAQVSRSPGRAPGRRGRRRRAGRRCRCAARSAGSRPRAARPRSSAPKITSSRVGAECTRTTSAEPARPARSMPMTGVMPLPAVTNRTRSGGRLGQHEVAAGPGRAGPACRAATRRTRWLLTLPSGIAFTVIVIRPSAPAGHRGERVRTPQAHPVDVDADPHVLARAGGRASRGRAGSRRSPRPRSRGGRRRSARAGRRRRAAGATRSR